MKSKADQLAGKRRKGGAPAWAAFFEEDQREHFFALAREASKLREAGGNERFSPSDVLQQSAWEYLEEHGEGAGQSVLFAVEQLTACASHVAQALEATPFDADAVTRDLWALEQAWSQFVRSANFEIQAATQRRVARLGKLERYLCSGELLTPALVLQKVTDGAARGVGQADVLVEIRAQYKNEGGRPPANSTLFRWLAIARAQRSG